MADLRQLFEKLGCSDVATYIQSGNVFFDTIDNINEIEIADKIEVAIKEKYGFDVPVIVTNHKDLYNAVQNNDFSKVEGVDIKELHLTFLKENPTKENIDIINQINHEPDEFKIHDKFVFLSVKGKYHKSKLTNNFFEKKLGVRASTRNWKTVLKLLELSQ